MPLFTFRLTTVKACALLVALFVAAPMINANAAAPTRAAKTEVAPAAMRLQLQNVPAHGMVAENVDVAPLANGKEVRAPRVLAADGSEVPSQFVPDESGSSRGLLLLQLPRGGDYDLQLQAGAPFVLPQKIVDAPLTASNSQVAVTFDARVGGGFPKLH